MLYKYTGQNNIIIGSPIEARNSVKLSNLIGMFVNNIALNLKIDDNETLERIISEGKARYNELSMVDAYILHMVMKNLLSFNGKAKVLKGIDNG